MASSDDCLRKYYDLLMEKMSLAYFINGEALTWREVDALHTLIQKNNAKQPSFEGQIEGEITIDEENHDQYVP